MFRLLDYGLLREPYFHLIAWPNAIVIAAYVNLMYALPGYVLSLGFSYYQSAFAISAFFPVFNSFNENFCFYLFALPYDLIQLG